jgi:hypothetical protein
MKKHLLWTFLRSNKRNPKPGVFSYTSYDCRVDAMSIG